MCIIRVVRGWEKRRKMGHSLPRGIDGGRKDPLQAWFSWLGTCGIFAELSRSDPDDFMKLPAEMFSIIIAAQPGDFGNALRGIDQKIPGFEQAEADHVIHAGNIKFLFV